MNTWLMLKEASELLNVSTVAINKKLEKSGSKVETRNYSFEYRFVKGVKGVENRALRKDHYEILLESMPDAAKIKYETKLAEAIVKDVEEVVVEEPKEVIVTANDELQNIIDRNNGLDAYNKAPKWQRDIVDKRHECILQSNEFKGEKLKLWIVNVWNIKYPENKTSYGSLCRWKKAFKDYGLSGLLSNYGKGNNNKNSSRENKYETFEGYFSNIKKAWYDVFKQLWLKEGCPSLNSCWQGTLGWAKIEDSDFNFKTFPSGISFKRAVEAQYNISQIYRARYGDFMWRKKYGYYIDRDYSNVKPGDCWVSDHAQLDVMVLSKDGVPSCPWITVWQDFTTGKWLGWTLFIGNPNSDRIFETWYKTALEFGLPKEILIDNGKDYRSKDFAGGRPKAHSGLVVGEEDAKVSMVHRMGIEVHFSEPYNSQAKPIERGFNTLKEALSKHEIGYRGGNVVERPEILQSVIKKGLIPTFEEFKPRFDYLIKEVINKNPNNGKLHKGRSRDKMFEDECVGLRMVAKEELKLFCQRTTKPIRIGRTGVVDRVDNITYYADWMLTRQKEYVYMRRDPLKYEEAWFYDMNDKYIDVAYVAHDVPAFYKTDLEREEVKKANARKRHAKKIGKEAIQNQKDFGEISQDEMMAMGAYSIAEDKGLLPSGKPLPIEGFVTTEFGDVLEQKAKKEKEGAYDQAILAPAIVKPKSKADIDIMISEYDV